MTGAKGLFVLGGLVVQFGLPRLMGSTAEYGLFAAATTLLAIVTNTLTQATVQTVSKHAALDGKEGESLRGSLILALGVGVVLASAFVLSAGFVAERVLHDAAVAPLLRIAGVIVVSYSIYATAVGYLNGRRHFDRQARLDASFTLVRTVALVSGAAIAGGAAGTMVGFATAAVTMAGVGLLFVGLGTSGSTTEASRGRWMAFFAPIALYQLAVNGLLQLDLEVLKARVAALAVEGGAAVVDAAERASSEAGLYRAAQSISFVPYQLIIAVTLVLFPTVARASAQGDTEGARAAVRGALRFSAIALVLLLTPAAGAAEGAMRVVFDARYLDGSSALVFLALGQIAFALFVVGATALSGDGAPVRVAAAASGGLLVVVVGATFAIDAVGVDGPVRAVTALSTATGSIVAFGIVVLLLRARFGAVVPWATLARVTLAGTMAFAVSHAVPQDSRALGLAALFAGLATGLVVLVVTRELGAADVALVRRIAGRR